MSRSPIRLGNPAFGWMAMGRPPASGSMCSSTSKSVLEPTEQLAPITCTGRSRRVRATSVGVWPRKVTRSWVKATWVMIGRSVMARMASTASRISVRSENVSTTKASAPRGHRAWCPWRRRPAAGAPGADRGKPRPSHGLPRARGERGRHVRGHLVGVEPGRLHDEIRLRVEPLARLVERLRLVAGLAMEHRPITATARALVEGGEIAPEPDDGADGSEGLQATFGTRQATTGGDDVAALEREQTDDLVLERPEVRLAFFREDLGDGAAFRGGDHLVRLHETSAEPAGEEAPDRGLSRSHEPDEDDVVRHGLAIVSPEPDRPYRRTVTAAGAR